MLDDTVKRWIMRSYKFSSIRKFLVIIEIHKINKKHFHITPEPFLGNNLDIPTNWLLIRPTFHNHLQTKNLEFQWNLTADFDYLFRPSNLVKSAGNCIYADSLHTRSHLNRKNHNNITLTLWSVSSYVIKLYQLSPRVIKKRCNVESCHF